MYGLFGVMTIFHFSWKKRNKKIAATSVPLDSAEILAVICWLSQQMTTPDCMWSLLGCGKSEDVSQRVQLRRHYWEMRTPVQSSSPLQRQIVSLKNE